MAVTFLCTFEGRPFRTPHPDLVDRLERFGYPSDFAPERTFPGPSFDKLGFPDLPAYPRPQLNQWFYPVGASRTSIFRGIMTAADVEIVKDIVWFSVTPSTGTFRIQNNTPESVGVQETEMYMLPPMPLDGEPGLYLITLVDERYYWHQCKSAGVITCTGTTSDWSEIIDQIKTALGVTLTYGAISADYGYPEPDSALYSNLESPAVLLDMVAANVGCAVVRAMNGTYTLQRWADAQVDVNANYTATAPIITAFGGRSVDTTGEAYRAVMPASVTVVFPKWVDGSGYNEPTSFRQYAKDSYGAVWSKNRTLANLGAPYSGYANTGLVKYIHDTAKARFTLVGDANPNNETALTTLADKIAKDYYDARTAWLDATYRGIRNLTPEGLSDILFSWDDRGVWTRVIPPPFNDGLSHFQHSTVNGGVAIPAELLFTITGRTGSQTIVSGDTILFNRTSVTATDTVTPDDASVTLPGDVNLTEQHFVGAKRFDTELSVGVTTNGVVSWTQPLTSIGEKVNFYSKVKCIDDLSVYESGTLGGMATAHQLKITLESSSGPSEGTITLLRPSSSANDDTSFEVQLWNGDNVAPGYLNIEGVAGGGGPASVVYACRGVKGVSGTGGGGDTFTGGIVTTLGSGPTSIANVTTGTLAIANGGTGATTAAGARTNLGLGALAVLNTVATAQIDDANVTNAKMATDAPRYASVPASATAAGVAGEIAYASGFLYICVAANTWERVAIATW